MLESALPFLAPLVAFGFLINGIRALIFATKYKDQLADANIVEKSLWWLKLFQKDGFGTKAERERRNISMWLIILGGTFFLGGAIVVFLEMNAAKFK